MQLPTVLHIDNNPHFREVFRHIIEGECVQVISRHGLVEAPEDIRKLIWDLLVVDSSGFDFANEVLKQSRHKSVIVLSGNPDRATFDATARIGKTDPDWSLKIKDVVHNLAKACLAPSYTSRGNPARFVAELTPELRERYSGKVLVLNASSDAVLHVASTLAEAEAFVRNGDLSQTRCWITQGPPQEEISLAELESPAL